MLADVVCAASTRKGRHTRRRGWYTDMSRNSRVGLKTLRAAKELMGSIPGATSGTKLLDERAPTTTTSGTSWGKVHVAARVAQASVSRRNAAPTVRSEGTTPAKAAASTGSSSSVTAGIGGSSQAMHVHKFSSKKSGESDRDSDWVPLVGPAADVARLLEFDDGARSEPEEEEEEEARATTSWPFFAVCSAPAERTPLSSTRS